MPPFQISREDYRRKKNAEKRVLLRNRSIIQLLLSKASVNICCLITYMYAACNSTFKTIFQRPIHRLFVFLFIPYESCGIRFPAGCLQITQVSRNVLHAGFNAELWRNTMLQCADLTLACILVTMSLSRILLSSRRRAKLIRADR